MHPDDIQRCTNLFQEALKTGEGFGEFRLRRNDNTYVWLEANVKVITDKQGKTKAVLVSRDINDRKIMEKKLIDTEEKYRHLFEHSPFSIVLIDLNGTIIDCNSATEKLIGYKREVLINENIRTLSMIHPNYLSIVANQFEKSSQGEMLPSIDIQLRKKDGSLIWINYTTSLINLTNENLIQVVLHDVTERRNSEALRFKEMNELKELDQIRNDLITRVSHELKTPLVSISGATELLLHYYNETFGVEESELIEMIDRGGKRLKYLVNNLIDISLFRHKKLTLKKQLHDMTLLIRECVKDFQFLIKEKNINVTLNLPEASYFNFDRPHIEQVISNLLSNALKNTPPHGKIQIILRLNEESAKMSIMDTGIGLTKDEMRRLFTQFGKIERYGKDFIYLNTEGAGLGLYICKEIVNLHEGQIWVESQGRYKGSTFVVKLPTK
jgi:PAS domain S-box-containing protein